MQVMLTIYEKNSKGKMEAVNTYYDEFAKDSYIANMNAKYLKKTTNIKRITHEFSYCTGGDIVKMYISNGCVYVYDVIDR